MATNMKNLYGVLWICVDILRLYSRGIFILSLNPLKWCLGKFVHLKNPKKNSPFGTKKKRENSNPNPFQYFLFPQISQISNQLFIAPNFASDYYNIVSIFPTTINHNHMLTIILL
ncbi:hypothetical protein QVD17_03916 [Tagetes erecta]|uniref:Uncharacterized protein n=1 Tax=Tagetes erecta TaxID=13708 RepID=A0AAD8LEG7_TARER|nr:hypothetical protein QVD17_03916 [Tagetes erecta]